MHYRRTVEEVEEEEETTMSRYTFKLAGFSHVFHNTPQAVHFLLGALIITDGGSAQHFPSFHKRPEQSAAEEKRVFETVLCTC